MNPRAACPGVVAIPPELASRASSYSLYPPSPPRIHVPAPSEWDQMTLSASGSFDDYDLAAEELKNLTEVCHLPRNLMSEWHYESRRSAQEILPFLYLGPSSTAKDRQFLRNEGITLLLVVRDLRSAQASLMSGDKVAQELGIVATAVDIESHMELIATFPHVIRIINDHLVTVHRQQTVVVDTASNGTLAVNQPYFKRGKVLVFCESGNERSASCVVAYIMAMYGLGVVPAMQVVQSKRFCIALNDDLRQLLLSFHDIICAQRDVRTALNQASAEAQNAAVLPSGDNGSGGTSKRDANDMDADEEACMDMERYLGRADFVPFSDNANA